MTVLILLFFLILPLLISYLTQRYKFFDKIGTVLLCYISGLIAGHTALFNETTHPLQDNIAAASVFLALPILLFDSNPRKWRYTSGTAIKSMFIAIGSLIVVTATSHVIFGHYTTDSWKTAGLLIGIYTGGTPNLASIKTALEVPNDTYISIHTIDTILGALYLLFLLTTGKTWFRKLLPCTKQLPAEDQFFSDKRRLTISEWLYAFPYKQAARGLLISFVIAGISAGSGMLFPENIRMTFIILFITTLAIGFAMLPTSRSVIKSFPAGMYLINLFSLAIASRANFYDIAKTGSTLFYYVAFVLFITFALHIIISRIFRIDGDTTIITSTALICSPPFVPVIAGSLNNKSVLIPGITVGVIGYAMGNYLGIAFAYLLK